LDYFRLLDRVHTYAWGSAALAFLYRELTHDTHPNYKYVARYMTLLQVTLNLFYIVYLVLFYLNLIMFRSILIIVFNFVGLDLRYFLGLDLRYLIL
jgi:hypothetical protein